MTIDIRGFLKSSFNEWEGRISAVIFTAGCNWRCPYCHGAALVKDFASLDRIDPEEIFDFIAERDGWVDGIAITGGEPTLQPGLEEFISDIKETGTQVKLETNGTNPEVIRKLLENKLLDCLCLDYKGPLDERLKLVTDVDDPKLEKVRESFDISRNATGVETEFHTTLCPAFIDSAVLEEMAKELNAPNALWVLQQYENDVEMLNREKAGRKRFSTEELDGLENIACMYHPKVLMRKGKAV